MVMDMLTLANSTQKAMMILSATAWEDWRLSKIMSMLESDRICGCLRIPMVMDMRKSKNLSATVITSISDLADTVCQVRSWDLMAGCTGVSGM